MSEIRKVKVPDDVAQRLDDLSQDRINTLVSDALRDALGVAEDAEDRRDELRQRMGLDGRDTEELDESADEVAQKQAELKDKMGPR